MSIITLLAFIISGCITIMNCFVIAGLIETHVKDKRKNKK